MVKAITCCRLRRIKPRKASATREMMTRRTLLRDAVSWRFREVLVAAHPRGDALLPSVANGPKPAFVGGRMPPPQSRNRPLAFSARTAAVLCRPQPLPRNAVHSLSLGPLRNGRQLAEPEPVALLEQVLDVPQRQRKPGVEHHRQPDDLGRGLEVPERAALGHAARLGSRPARLKIVALTLPIALAIGPILLGSQAIQRRVETA